MKRIVGQKIALAVILSGVISSATLARAQGDLILEPLAIVGEGANTFLSSGVEEAARWLDTFLGGEDAYEGNTGSLIQAEIRTIIDQYEGVSSQSSVRARLVLPRTQERLNLVLQSDADDSAEQSDLSFIGDYLPVDKPSAFGAALEGIIIETKRWKAALRGGVQTKMPPDAFVRLDLRRRWFPWSARITADEKGYWYAVKGLANKFRLSLDLPLDGGWLLRPSVGTGWKEEENGYDWDSGFGFYGRLNDKDAFLMDVRATGRGSYEPITNSYSVTAELSHKLYRNWVYIGVGPGMVWSRERDFDPALYLGFRFDLIFSKALTEECETTPQRCGLGEEPPAQGLLPDPYSLPPALDIP